MSSTDQAHPGAVGRHSSAGQPAGSVVVKLEDVEKQFGPTRALRGISIELIAGEVHALVGENGAGKSTCLSVMAGRVAPDLGEVHINGTRLRTASPSAARKLGVAAVYQELTPFPALSAVENVFAGALTSNLGVLRKGPMLARYRELTQRYGVKVRPDVPVGSLSIADQQLVEILRGVNLGVRALLFDEPTASLGVSERKALHAMIRDLRDSGTAIGFVSHDLDEVLELSDRVTVFRDGAVVDSRLAADWTKSELMRSMLGKELVALVARGSEGKSPGPEVLSVQNLRVGSLIQGINFSLGRGEVLGVAGLVGSGRTTLLSALSGRYREARGDVRLNGQVMKVPTRTYHASQAGFVLLPEDRRGEGLFLALTAAENIVAPRLGPYSRFGWLSWRRIREATSKLSDFVEFPADRLSQAARGFSGGNQQKLLIARALQREPAVLLADEPTRGIDVGAKAQILLKIRSLADEGVASILASSDPEELCAVCDRVLVLHEGHQMGVLHRNEGELIPAKILQLSFGAQENAQ
jgi:ABC-type sugar transport system ATPase subunit